MQCKQMTYYASRWHTRQVRHKLTTYHLLACWLKSIRYHHPQWSWQGEVDVCLAQAHWGSPHTWPSGTRPHRKVSPVSTLSAQKQQHWEEYDWSLWETRNHGTKYMLMNNRKDIANIKLSQVLVNQVKSYSSTLATFVYNTLIPCGHVHNLKHAYQWTVLLGQWRPQTCRLSQQLNSFPSTPTVTLIDTAQQYN